MADIKVKQVIDALIEINNSTRKKTISNLTSMMQEAGDTSSAAYAKKFIEALNSALNSAGRSDLAFDIKDFINAETMGQNIAKQIIAGMQQGLSGGAGSVAAELEKQLSALKAEQASLVAEQSSLQGNLKNKTRLEKIGGFELPDEASLKKIKDANSIESIRTQAEQARQEFSNAYDQMINVIDVESKEYTNAVLNAQEKLNAMYKMNSVMEYIPKYPELANERKAYSNILKDEYGAAAETQENFDGIDDVFEDAAFRLEQIESRLKTIGGEIDKIKLKAKEVNSINIVSDDGNKLEGARQRLRNTTGLYNSPALKKIDSVIQEAESAGTTKITEGLDTLYKNYNQAVASGEGWEKEYLWLSKFVQKYQQLQAMGTNKATLGKYEDTYKSFTEGGTYNQAISDLKALRQLINDTPVKKINADKTRTDNDLNIIKQENTELEKQKALLIEISGLSSTGKEKFAYLNTMSGKMSPHIEGGYEGVSTSAQQELLKSIGGVWDSTMHTHPENLAAPSEEDIQSFVGYYETFKRNFIRAGQQLAEIDFTSLTQQQAQQLASTYKQNILNTEDARVERLGKTPMKDLGVASVDIDSTLAKMSEQLVAQFPNLIADINTYIENLRAMFKQNPITNLSQDQLEENISDSVDTSFKGSNRDIQSDIYQTTKDVIDNVTGIPAMYQKELQGLFTQTISDLGFDSSKIFKLHDLGELQAQRDAIQQTTKVQQQLNQAKSQEPKSIDESGQITAEAAATQQQAAAQEKLNAAKMAEPIDEDEVAIIQAENGSLEQKLALLQDIAEQYGVPITQKTRDAYERLNQKDMDTGLTPAQDERFWELGETIDQADTNLMEFEQTYDRIVLKLANGKNISILPDDKGLRSLDKIASEYYTGEYNGVEIEDVKFERAKKVAEAEHNVTAEKQNQAQVEAELKAKEEEALRLAKEKAEAERLAAEAKKQQEAQAAAAKAREEEAIRLANEKAEAERRAAELKKQQEDAAAAAAAKEAEATRLAEEKANAERIAAEALKNSAGVTTGAVVQTGATTGEITNLNALKTVIESVTTAVNDKTTAFTNEATEVARVAAAEIAALQPLEERINSIKSILATVIESLKGGGDLGASLSNLNIKVTTAAEGKQDNTALISSIQSALSGIKFDSTGMAQESTLGRVAAACEAINAKIVGNISGEVQSTATTESTSMTDTSTKEKESSAKKKESGTENKTEENQKEAATVKELNSLYEQLGKLQAERDVSAEGSNQRKELDALIQKKNEEITAKEEGIKVDKQAFDTKRMEAYTAKLEKLKIAEAKRADTAANSASKKAFNDQVKAAQKEAGVTKTGNVIQRAEGAFQSALGIENLTPENMAILQTYQRQIDALKQSLIDFKNIKGPATPEQQQALRTQTQEVNTLTIEIAGLVEEYNRLSGTNTTPLNTQHTLTANSSLYDFEQQLKSAVLEKHPEAKITGFDAATKRLTYTLKTGKHEVTSYSAQLRGLDGQLVSTQGQTKRTATFFESLGLKIKQLVSYYSGMMLIYRAIAMVRQGVTYIKEIDSALTELKKVTNETEATYEKFLDTASKTASRIGSTITDVTKATAEFARLGYSIKQATEMAEAAIIYKNVGDGIENVEDASSSIISTLKAFGYEANESMNIVSRFNEVGNNFAITSKGIGDALQRSASALHEGGNTLDESIGLITAANSVVQDPEVVGTAFKTLAMRLRGAKTELQDAGLEVDNMATTTSELQSRLLALTDGKVNIMVDETTFKSTTEILREMSAAWEDMTDIERASALELMGGKRQANVLSALITNFDVAEDAIESSANSAGSALRENEVYLDSIQGKMDVFNNTVQTTWNDLIGSEFIKNIVDAGTALLKVVDTIGIIPTILASIATFKMGKMLFGAFNVNQIKAAVTTMKMYNAELVNGSVSQTLLNSTTTIWSTIQDLLKGKLLSNIIVKYAAKKADEALELAKYKLVLAEGAFKMGLASTKDVQEAQMGVEAASILVDKLKIGSTLTLSDAFKILGASILSSLKIFGKWLISPIGLFLSVTAVVIGLVSALGSAHKTLEDLEEEFDGFNSKLSETESQLESLNAELEKTSERIKELSGQGSLSFIEQEELANLKAQSEELQRQIDLTELLRKSQQKDVNKSASGLIDKYNNTGVNSGLTTGEKAGSWAKKGAIGTSIGGAVIGTALASAGSGAAAGAAAGTTVAPIIGTIIGAIVGVIAGAIVGGVAGGISGAFEEKVGASVDNMRENYEKLQKDYEQAQNKYESKQSDGNYEKMQKAQEKLTEYESAMGERLTQLKQYADSIDIETATAEQLAEKIAVNDQLDKWAIQSGGDGAKSNAIGRIFGEEASDQLNLVKKQLTDVIQTTEGIEDLGDINISDMFANEVEFTQFKSRIDDLGVSLTDIKYYFYDLREAEKEALENVNIYDTVKQVATLEDNIDSLKNAMSEFNENGIVSGNTLVELSEMVSGIEDIDDEWSHFVNTVGSGISTFEEASEATKELLEQIVLSKLSQGKLEIEEYIALIGQLSNLGVVDAKGFVDSMQIQATLENISDEWVNGSAKVYDGINKDGKKEAGVFKSTGTNSKGEVVTLNDEELKDYAETYFATGADDYGLYINTGLNVDEKTGQDAVDNMQDWLDDNPVKIYADLEGEELENALDALISKWETEMGITLPEDTKKELIDLSNKAKQAENNYENVKQQQGVYEEELKKAQEIKDDFELKKKEYGYEDFSSSQYSSYVQGGYRFYKNKETGEIIDPEIYSELEALEKKVQEADANLEVNPDVESAKKAAEDAKTAFEDKLKELGYSTIEIELIEKNQLLDDIQSVYDTLKSAQKEYREEGYLTVDTMQALFSLDAKYLALLFDENGQLNLNEDALYRVAEAKATDMVITQQSAILENAMSLAMNGSREALIEYTSVIGSATEANMGFVDSQLKAIKAILKARTIGKEETVTYTDQYGVTHTQTVKVEADLSDTEAESIYAGIVNNVNAASKIGEIVIPNIRRGGLSDSQKDSGDVESTLESLQKYYERLISELDNQITQLENEVDRLEAENEGISKQYYEEQIDREEKKLDLYEAQLGKLKELQANTPEGSDEWWEISDALWEVEHAMQETTMRMIEGRKAIVELYETAFDRVAEAYDNKTQLKDDQLASLQNYAELLEMDGVTPTASLFEAQKSRISERMANNQAKLASTNAIVEQLKAEQSKYEVGSADWNYYDELLVDKRAEQRQIKLDLQTDQKDFKQIEKDFEDALLSAWDAVMDAFNNKNAFFEGQQGFIDSYIGRLETLNINVPDEAYEKQIEVQEKINKNNRKALAQGNKELASIGEQFGKDSAEYLEKQRELGKLEQAVYEGETKRLKLQKQIIDNQFDRFNQILDRINDSINELDRISGLISDEDVATKDGEWTAEGLTRAGFEYEKMAYSKNNIEEINAELAHYDELLADGAISEKEHYEKTKELKDQLWNNIEAYKASEDAIIDLQEARIDMIESGLQEEIDAYAELIELKKEELDAERDLFKFRRDVEDQSKNIAEIERRIASLSGSSSDEDRAEMKRLQKELSEANRGLDDTYRNHSYDQTSRALDEELEAFEKNYEDYIQGLRDELENTDELIKRIYADVVSNGQLVFETLVQLSDEYGFTLDANLTSPWVNANGESLNFEIAATQHYDNVKTAVNTGTQGFIDDITQPWEDGTSAANTFSNESQRLYDIVIDKAKTNQQNLSDYLSSPWETAGNMIDQTVSDASSAIDRLIMEAEEAAREIEKNLSIATSDYSTTQTYNDNGNNNGNRGGGTNYITGQNVTNLQKILNQFFKAGLSVDGVYGPATKTAVTNMQKSLKDAHVGGHITVNGEFDKETKDALQKYLNKQNVGSWFVKYNVSVPAAMYAKGTLGTQKDQWAITDEYGPELTLIPGKNGNLSFMRAGTGVVPADLTKRIMEIAQMPTSELGNNIIKAVVPNIETTNQAVQVNFEALVKADNITNDVLPEVEKLVEKQLNNFTRNLNYSLKKVGGR